MDDEAVEDEFLMRVATYIDASELTQLRREWGVRMFEDVTVYVWSRIPCLVRRLVKLVEWGGYGM